ncbi:MAG: hypothetical protein DRH04_03420 [Deltaproteobacteria bacterium]|nr:MAG: hypothetical protein DRH04_03420 [Deltaproteobacteria bacterium]
MSIYNLDHLFNPQTIGLLGRYDCHSCLEEVVYENLKSCQEKHVVMINLEGCQGRNCWFRNYGPCYGSLDEAPADIDLLIVSLPLTEIPAVLAAGGKCRVKNMIITRGREAAESDAHEQEIIAAARKNGIRLLGFKSFGLIVPGRRFNTSFFEAAPADGHMALISQSGAIISSILDLAAKKGVGFSHVVSLGSLADIDFGDIIDYLGWEYNVRGILLYIENLHDVKKFLSACRSVSMVKPIVAIKGGKSDLAREVVQKHTGYSAGDDHVYDTALRRAGVIRVQTIDELLAAGVSLSPQSLTAGENLGVITNSGGVGVLVVDSLLDRQLPLAVLPNNLQDRLQKDFQPYSGGLNPICISNAADSRRFIDVIELSLVEGNFDTMMVVMILSGWLDPTLIINEVRKTAAEQRVKMMYIWLGNRGDHAARAIELEDAGTSIFFSVEDAVNAYFYGMRYYAKLKKVVVVPPRFSRAIEYDYHQAEDLIASWSGKEPRRLSESAGKEILEAYRLPVNETRVVRSFAEAVEQAAAIGYPVVLKNNDPAHYYRSDFQGVRLGLSDRDALARAWMALEAANGLSGDHGFTVQKMIGPGAIDLHLGTRTDREFGPYIFLGMCGLSARMRANEAVILPPLNRLLAGKLIEKSWLHSCRQWLPFELEKLEEILVRLSQLVVDFPQLLEIDVDPLMFHDGRFQVVDVKVVLQDRGLVAPEHLATTPYPNQYEFHAVLRDGTKVLVRPIRPEDAEAHYAFVSSLSRQTSYYRFFSYEKELDDQQMSRFTQIDYDREIAIIAVVEQDGREVTIGVNRLVYYAHSNEHEFAIVVADEWQQSGVAAILMEKLIEIARDRRLKSIYGLVLSDNIKMLRFSKKFGFRITGREDDMVRIELDLTQPAAGEGA